MRSRGRKLAAEPLPVAFARRTSAGVLSLVLVLAGVALVAVGALGATAAVIKAVEGVDGGTAVACVIFLVAGLAVVVGGVRLITRVRPRAVRRLTGRDVPRVPTVFSTRGGGGYVGGWGDGGGDCGGGGGGGDGGGGGGG